MSLLVSLFDMDTGSSKLDAPLDLIPGILRRAGLRPSGSIVQAPDDTANLIFFVDGEITIRIGRGADGECFPKSAQILERVGGQLRAPRVLSTDFSREFCPANVMVCEVLSGETLCSSWRHLTPWRRQQIFGGVVAELQKLHQFEPRLFSLCGVCEPWPQLFGDQLRQLFAKAAQRESVVPLETLERQIETAWPVMDSSRAAVVHNDVHWNNILVEEGEFSGLLDFDDAIIGLPEIDLMSLLHSAAGAQEPQLPCVFSRPELLRRTAAMVREIWPEMFARPGFAQRYAILCAREILLILTEDVPWMSPDEAGEEARIMYEACFVSPGLRAWIS